MAKPANPGSMTERDSESYLAKLVTQCVTSWNDAPNLAAQWRDLLERTAWSSIFQTYEWNRSWWDAFGGSCELRLVLCYESRNLVAIAPMMISKAHPRLGRIRSQLCFIGSANNSSDYCDFLLDPAVPGVIEAILEQVCQKSHEADCLHITNIPSHSPNYGPVTDYLRRHYPSSILESDQLAPTRILNDPDADRKATNKASLRRRTNYFEKAGDLSFKRCRSKSEILGYMDAFFEQHKARRQLAGSPSQFYDRAQQEFYKSVVESMFVPGWLKFDVVTFNGKPLAMHFGFEYRKSFIWYKPTFDVAFASRSPGEVLIRFLLQDAIDRHLREFDFTVGDEPFKFRFANTTRFNMRVILFRANRKRWTYCCKSYLRQMRNKLTAARARKKSGSV